jgi:hypothetical protein
MKNYLKIMVQMLVLSLLVLQPQVWYAQQQEHREIIEEVEVKWWLVPVFALGKDGKAILDLKAEDLEVWLNNKRVTTFEFYKRTYGVTPEQGSQASPADAGVTQQSLLKNLVPAYNVQLDDIRAETGRVVYVITLPPNFLNQVIDLYKIRIANKKDENGVLVMSEVEGIEKETLIPGKNQMEISFKTVKSTQSAGKKGTREVFTYFVLIDGKSNTARLHGVIDIEPDPELREN